MTTEDLLTNELNTCPEIMDNLPELQDLLSECQQSHLLKFWDDLDIDQQRTYINQLQALDFKQILDTYQKAQSSAEEYKAYAEKMQPIKVEAEEDVETSDLEEYRSIGLNEIGNNRVAVVVLAGGHGSRLGMPFPKGMCNTGLPSGKTLFQLQAERIRRLMVLTKEQTGLSGTIYWYIMTSEFTHNLTDKYMKEKKYFGLDKDSVKLFKQASFPSFHLDGKIMLEENDSIAFAPDGNGGLYEALAKNGILEHMDAKRIKYVHVHSVDNILVKVAEPGFIGKCVKSEVDCGVKVVRKVNPDEPLGVVCKVDDKYQVVEYSEISTEKANLQDENGDLVFSAGNICNYFFTTDFLKKIAYEHKDCLKWHIAHKIITFMTNDGDKSRPTTPNGIKLEKFIFDVLPLAENVVVWEVPASHEFSPVKNCQDSKMYNFPSATKDLYALHKSYVEKAGAAVSCACIEISPLLSYAGESLERMREEVFESDTIVWSREEDDGRWKWN